jgi:hypothetical protein
MFAQRVVIAALKTSTLGIENSPGTYSGRTAILHPAHHHAPTTASVGSNTEGSWALQRLLGHSESWRAPSYLVRGDVGAFHNRTLRARVDISTAFSMRLEAERLLELVRIQALFDHDLRALLRREKASEALPSFVALPLDHGAAE